MSLVFKGLYRRDDRFRMRGTGDDAFDDAFDVDDLTMVVLILNNAKIRSKVVSSAKANEIFETLRPIERRSPGQY